MGRKAAVWLKNRDVVPAASFRLSIAVSELSGEAVTALKRRADAWGDEEKV
jgi:hypothetical protein